jgi:hypothetical protein
MSDTPSTAMAAAQQDSRALTPIEIVARAAADPNVDADKLAKLYDIQDRHQRREAEIEFNRAMMLVQAEVRTIIKNRPNTQTGSDYANIDAILRVLRPCYTKHGFSLSFSTVPPIIDGTIRVRGILRHMHGHSEEHFYDCPLDGVGIAGKANKTATHAAASSASYAQRILTVLMFNMSTGYDDDGNAAGGAVLTPAEEKANSWVARAAKIETPQQYETERQAMLEAYGAVGDEAAVKAAMSKIPGSVKRAFADAKNDVMPRDDA